MSTVPMNDLRRAFDADGDALRAATLEVLDGGWYVHGPQHAAFEQELAAFVGVEHAVGVASGTDGLELVLTALAARCRRRTVITAANAGGYTSVAACQSGLNLRFADVSPDTLCLDAGEVERLLDDDVVAVVLTHIYGRLGDVDSLAKLCAEAGVPLVEDCAQAVGAAHGKRRAGAFGAAGTFSFYPTKNLGALGDGGAVVTDDHELADSVRRLRQYGWSSKYKIGVPDGRNSRLDELQAAVLRVRLPRVTERNARRRDVIARYRAAGARSVQVLAAEGEHHVGHLAVAICRDREAAQTALAAAGVASEVHYPVPDHWQPAFVAQHDGRSLPVSEDAANRALSLPCFPEMTEHELDRVCAVLSTL